MREKPILFSSSMVRAILDGRKSMTRRVVKPQPVLDGDRFWQWKDCQWADGGLGIPQSAIDDYAPYQPGDILWVRETWASFADDTGHIYLYYKANEGNPEKPLFFGKWKPSIHMPREAARIFLEVKSVRIERLRDISEEDAKAEGVEPIPIGISPAGKAIAQGLCTTYRTAFCGLWDTLNAKRGYGWDVNPWVWVITFERVEAR